MIDGCIDKREVVRILSAFGIKLPISHRNKLVDHFDTKQNGRLEVHPLISALSAGTVNVVDFHAPHMLDVDAKVTAKDDEIVLRDGVNATESGTSKMGGEGGETPSKSKEMYADEYNGYNALVITKSASVATKVVLDIVDLVTDSTKDISDAPTHDVKSKQTELERSNFKTSSTKSPTKTMSTSAGAKSPTRADLGKMEPKFKGTQLRVRKMGALRKVMGDTAFSRYLEDLGR